MVHIESFEFQTEIHEKLLNRKLNIKFKAYIILQNKITTISTLIDQPKIQCRGSSAVGRDPRTKIHLSELA